jgi:uncharacterized membrane protein
MYAWLWRHLPGPFGVRLLTAVLLVVVVVVVLFAWVFPWLEPRLPFTDVTVQEGAAVGVLRTLAW